MGSNAWAWLSLTADQPHGTRVCPRGEARDYAGRWRVPVGATRHGGGGPHDQLTPEKPGTEGFRINVSVPTIFCGAATRSLYSTNPSPSWYPIIESMPHVVYLGLS
jgi:hypothetical protein